ncbi:hypothetical protein PISMIDRAFT_679995 [Pisolithus microcarpus 441]|uniref:Uncharacterized protein n=1 Tax=Pisolithus microcarpus 441 TaxID=765257 RepID=A0A0C9ZJW0_9AGAM|nr:hypothetical protein BKA83DRAFT_679995 [Pisolithus microcarpus]KIK22757.1 hypothetical protein PISMIDRAFT_679995 [Pisolithus microcarpus 441]
MAFLKIIYNGFQEEEKVDDLNKAITSFRAASELLPYGTPEQSLILNGLAFLLEARYVNQGAVSDLGEVTTLRRAAPEPRPSEGQDNHQFSLAKLIPSLTEVIFGRSEENTDDLNEAITMSRAALKDQSLENYEQSTIRNTLLLLLLKRYVSRRAVADLEEVVTLEPGLLPLEGLDDSSIDLVICHAKASHGGSSNEDLNETIASFRTTLEHQPPRNRRRSLVLTSLALALVERYNERGSIADLEEVVMLGRTELQLHPSEGQDSSLVAFHLSLAKALRNRTPT